MSQLMQSLLSGEDIVSYPGQFAHPEEFLCCVCVHGHTQLVDVSSVLGQRLVLLDQGRIDCVDALPASSCEVCRQEIICDLSS